MKLKILKFILHKVGPCILTGWLLKAGNKLFFTLKALHKSFTTNYAFNDEIKDTGAFITQGRSIYINWMVVKTRKQTFLHIKGIIQNIYRKLCI